MIKINLQTEGFRFSRLIRLLIPISVSVSLFFILSLILHSCKLCEIAYFSRGFQLLLLSYTPKTTRGTYAGTDAIQTVNAALVYVLNSHTNIYT